MDSFTRADLFFAVTTGAIVLLTVCFVVVLAYAIRILHEVRLLIAFVRREGEALSEDVSTFRAKIVRQGFTWTLLFGFLRKLWRRRSARKKDKEEVE